MGAPNLPEAVYLLCCDRAGRLRGGSHAGLSFALVGAGLIELHRAGRLALDDRGWEVRDPSPLGNEALDALLGEVLLLAVDKPLRPLLWTRLLQLLSAGAELKESLPRSIAARDQEIDARSLIVAAALLEAGLIASTVLEKTQRRELADRRREAPLGEPEGAVVAAVQLACAA
jgi:hypothetical protein